MTRIDLELKRISDLTEDAPPGYQEGRRMQFSITLSTIFEEREERLLKSILRNNGWDRVDIIGRQLTLAID